MFTLELSVLTSQKGVSCCLADWERETVRGKGHFETRLKGEAVIFAPHIVTCYCYGRANICQNIFFFKIKAEDIGKICIDTLQE